HERLTKAYEVGQVAVSQEIKKKKETPTAPNTEPKTKLSSSTMLTSYSSEV
ncbi:16724_t:CDS:2, partial [Cetraspora pellucida]